jgi:hypothetical protein
VRGFGKKMDVIRLHGVLDDTELGARGDAESTLDHGENAGGAQAAEAGYGP